MAALLLSSCSGNRPEAKKSAVGVIQTQTHYNRIIEAAGDKLLVLDLYADWCMPCKMLSPLLEDIAGAYKDRADFYKINVDNNPGISRMFGVSGIPYVVFVRNKEMVHSLTGVQPRETYVEAIERYSR